MQNVTYREMLGRYGQNLAYDLLITIEKLAKTGDDVGLTDKEARLQRALAALNHNAVTA